MAKLSIIIPFGTSKERAYIKERVEHKARTLTSDENVEYIFVEGYSSLEFKELKEFIKACGHKYLKDEKQEFFSQGQCRNLGVIHAQSKVIMFLDVDYYLSQRNLKLLLDLIELKGIENNLNGFLALPCVFLNQNASQELINLELEAWDKLIKHDMCHEKKLIKFISPASSALVMNKHKFIELGGNDKDFVGHGYEDFDLMFRVCKECGDFECLPANLDFDYRGWGFDDFKGFRALFALIGQEAIFHGIYLYHLWHEEPNQNGYLDNRELNHQKFYSKIKAYKNAFDGPDPLHFDEAKGKTLMLFSPQNGAVYKSLRSIMPYFERIICVREYYFYDKAENFDAEYFLSFYEKNKITHICFPNSHANTKRLEIFNFVKAKKLPFLVYDRGALPDSWFFDDKGFNYASKSYDESLWNKPLDEEQIKLCKAYIASVLKGESFLEKQGVRQGSEALRRKLGLRHKKIIFVPLQVLNDSVLRCFSYEPFSYEGFLNIINELALKLEKENIVFVVKKHPLSLELDKKAYEGLKFVNDDTNLLDLLELCDMVLTLNSGVGVYAILANKPCVVCANAFYHFEGLNLQAKDEKELKEHILSIFNGKFSVDTQKALRFIYYLRYEFYSFGKSFYAARIEQNRKIHAVFRIDFYQLIIAGVKKFELLSAKKQKFKLNSPIYKPFLYEINTKKLFTNKDFDIEKTIITTQKTFMSKFKATRLLKKLLTHPKDFIMDSKNPLMKPIKILVK